MKRQGVVIGTGGHCRVLLSLLAAKESHDVIGIVDLGEPRPGEIIMGYSNIYSADWLSGIADQSVDAFLAIGDNYERAAWYQKTRELGLNLPNLISPQAMVDPCASLGAANVVCARAFIGPGAQLGDNNLVNTGAIIEHEVRIGSHCHFAPSSTIAGRTEIDNNVFVGAGATLIDRISVGADVTIGAGAVVVDTIPPTKGTYVGVPARRVN